MVEDPNAFGVDTIEDAILRQIVEELGHKPSCERILGVLEKEPKLANQRELQNMYLMGLQHPEEIRKLVIMAFTPEKLGCRNPRYRFVQLLSWPFLAAQLLRKEPTVLLPLLIDPPGAGGRVLFEWLSGPTSATALGYFGAILSCTGNEFQDKLMEFFIVEREMLQLCLANCVHFDVFMVLFNNVLQSGEAYRESQKKVLFALFEKVFETKNQTQLCENALEMMKTVNQSKGSPTEWVFSLILEVVNEEYMAKAMQELASLSTTNEEACENLLQMLKEFIKLYVEVSKQKTIELGNSEVAITKVIKSMHVLADILSVQSKEQVSFSNGENVATVGLMRYYTLELMSSLLALPSKLVSDNFDVNKAKILYLLEVNSTVNQTFISRNPWNNMVHRLVESIVVNIVNSFESYAESEDTYIGEKGFLGFLIETFKNHDYMFLNSCKLSTYGYIHYLYNIGTAICSKLQKSEDLRTIMQKFEPWQRFVVDDLQEYEKNIDQDLGEPIATATAKKLNTEQSIRKIVIDMNRKEISVMADKEDECDEFLDRFVEIIKDKIGFKPNRMMVARKNSADSNRKRSGSDSQKQERHLDVSSEKPKGSMFGSQNTSPQREQIRQLGPPGQLSPMSEHERQSSNIILHTTEARSSDDQQHPHLTDDDKQIHGTPSPGQTILSRTARPIIKVSEFQTERSKNDYRSRSECKPLQKEELEVDI